MRIAILGTGMIGSAIAEALLKEGHSVLVYNRTTSKTEPLIKLGALAMPTPQQAILESDAAILAVYGGNVLREVLFDNDIKPVLVGKKLLTVSTSEAEEIKAIANELDMLECSLSELAITSGAVEVKTKQGFGVLGCKKIHSSFWKEIMGAIGEVVYVGEVGRPAIAVTPSIIGAGLKSLHLVYSVAFAIKMNIPQEVIVKEFSPFMPDAEKVVSALFARDYSLGAASVEGYRDTIEIALKNIEISGLPTKVFDDILSLYDKASELGFGDQSESALMEALLE